MREGRGTSVEQEILDEIYKLRKGQQVEFAKSEMKGIPGKALLRFAGTIDREDLDRMAGAIQADCEGVNPNE